MKDLQLINIDHAHVKNVGLVINERTPYPEWEKVGDALKAMEGALQWWIGDWLNFGEGHYGEMYAQATEMTHYDPKTLANLKWVASRIEISRRREDVSWSKHADVAGLDPVEQDQILAKAAAMTRQEIRDVVKSIKDGEPIPEREKCPTCGRPL